MMVHCPIRQEARLSEEQSKFGRYLGYVAAIVGILAVVVPVTVWAVDHFTSSPATSANTATHEPGGTTTPPSAGTTAPAATGGAHIPLLGLPIDTGGSAQGTLPHALDGDHAYDGALVLACPAGSVSDKNRSITFVLSGHYATFHADLRPYHSTSDESQVEYVLFPDGGTAPKFFVDVNDMAAANLDVHDVQKLTVWITCTDRDASAILANAYVVHV
jgi:hypothetical protein